MTLAEAIHNLLESSVNEAIKSVIVLKKSLPYTEKVLVLCSDPDNISLLDICDIDETCGTSGSVLSLYQLTSSEWEIRNREKYLEEKIRRLEDKVEEETE